MTPTQTAIASAYAHVFAPGPQTAIVMDDLLQWAQSITDPLVRSGAILMWGQMMNKARALRREQRRQGK